MADSRAAWDRPRAPWNFLSVEKGLRWLRSQTWVARPLPVDDLTGAVHVYVGPTGDDGNDGKTAAEPFATIEAGIRRVNEWLLLQLPLDIVLDVAAGDYNVMDIEWRLPIAPRRRVIFRGPVDGMTTLASGTLTAASVNDVTDAGAALGATHQHARRILRVWDPLNEAATVQYKTIRSHTDTVVTPVGPFSITPLAGWSYRIQRPGVRIIGTARARHALSIVLPWSGGAGSTFPDAGPGFILAWIQVEKNSLDDDGGLMISGGDYALIGVVVETNTFTAAALSGFGLGGFFTFETADLVLGLGAFDFGTFWDAGLGILVNPSGGAVGVRFDTSNWNGPIVVGDAPGCDFPIFATSRANVSIRGGATHRGRPIVGENCVADFLGGTFGTAIPFLLRNSPSHGIEYRGGSVGTVGAVAFEAVAGAAVSVGVAKRGAQLQVDGPLTEVGAGVTGFCLDAQDAAQIAVAAGVAGFVGGAGEIRVDSDGTGTFAGLIVGAPKIGTNTGARVWRQ